MTDKMITVAELKRLCRGSYFSAEHKAALLNSLGRARERIVTDGLFGAESPREMAYIILATLKQSFRVGRTDLALPLMAEFAHPVWLGAFPKRDSFLVAAMSEWLRYATPAIGFEGAVEAAKGMPIPYLSVWLDFVFQAAFFWPRRRSSSNGQESYVVRPCWSKLRGAIWLERLPRDAGYLEAFERIVTVVGLLAAAEGAGKAELKQFVEWGRENVQRLAFRDIHWLVVHAHEENVGGDAYEKMVGRLTELSAEHEFDYSIEAGSTEIAAVYGEQRAVAVFTTLCVMGLADPAKCFRQYSRAAKALRISVLQSQAVAAVADY